MSLLRRQRVGASELVRPISQIRDSVCAVLRVHPGQAKKKRGTVEQQFRLAFVGTAWCAVDSKMLVTAHHILNGGKARDPADKFYGFIVPNNEERAYHFPVTDFIVEDQSHDMAILEIGLPPDQDLRVPAVPVTFRKPADGSRVITYGFPAPQIHGAHLSASGEFLGGGQFFLKAHANEGIVAGQFRMGDSDVFEFNVGWHHGESGGPVLCLEPLSVFAVMQRYRNIASPHGIMAGPHVGPSLAAIRATLESLGAKIV